MKGLIKRNTIILIACLGSLLTTVSAQDSQPDTIWDVTDYSQFPAEAQFLGEYPQQDTNLNFPKFSWDKIPRWVAVRNGDRYSQSQIEAMAHNYQLVMFEKANFQGFPTIEEGIIDAAKRVKTVNSDVKTLFYWNTRLGYGGYAADSAYLANEWEWTQRTIDKDGNEILFLHKDYIYWYNHEAEGMRNWWLDVALGMANQPEIDGVFLDRSYGDTPFLYNIDGEPIDNYTDMLIKLNDSIPDNKIIIGNTLRNERANGNRSLMEITDGSYLERWAFRNRSFTQTEADAIAVSIQLMREALLKGKIINLQSAPSYSTTETEPTTREEKLVYMQKHVYFPLAVFLIIAEENAYFSYNMGVNAAANSQDVWDASFIKEFGYYLGEPLGEPTKNGYVYKRSYDNLDVTVNISTKKTTFKWKNKISPANANLSAITWPDMPFFMEGWKGDTIPGFCPLLNSYIVTVPYETVSVPALVAVPANLRANIQTTRATSLTGSMAERTTRFRITAEDGSAYNEYTVVFNRDKPDELIQKITGRHPFISELVLNCRSHLSFTELVNPNEVPLDFSEYLIVRSTSLNPAQAIQNAVTATPTDDNFQNRYLSYVPGYKYSDDTTTWKTSPGKLYIDPEVDPFVEPGGVFIMGRSGLGRREDFVPAEKDALVQKWWDAGRTGSITSDGVNVNAVVPWLKRAAEAVFIFKILNDSIFNGTKQVGDPNDFLLVDVFGDDIADGIWNIAGRSISNNQQANVRRNPNVNQGVTEIGEGAGTNADDSDWMVRFSSDPGVDPSFFENIGFHIIHPGTSHFSSISSLNYLVSDGFEGLQTIQGDMTGKTLEQFYQHISKADTGQVLTMKSNVDGSEKTPENIMAGNDTLVVVSADGTNTTRYLIINQPLDDNVVLVAASSSGYTIAIDGSKGRITGMSFGTSLREVLDNVIKPGLATLNVIDTNENLIPLLTRTTFAGYVEGEWLYSYEYVDTKVGNSYLFEVVAQNGVNVITYKIEPDVLSDDAFVISSVYRVNQDSLIISGIPGGTSVSLFFSNVDVVRGASAQVTGKMDLPRETGLMQFDDRLVVVSEDQSITVTYYLDFLTETDPDRAGDPTYSEQVKINTGQLVIYPNPVNERFYIKNAPENATIILTDLMGRTISITRAADSNDGISLADQPAGIYLLIVTDHKNFVRHVKIIKK